MRFSSLQKEPEAFWLESTIEQLRRSCTVLLVVAALLTLAFGDRLRDRNTDPTSQTTVTASMTLGELQHDELTRNYRLFVPGHSNGAIMTFRFACERADLITAIAPVAGSLEIPDCPATRGVSLLAIHSPKRSPIRLTKRRLA